MKTLIFLIVLWMPAIAFGGATIKDWTEWGESSRIQFLQGFLRATIAQSSVCNNSWDFPVNAMYQGIIDKEATERMHRHLLVLIGNNANVDLNSNLHAVVYSALFVPIPEKDRLMITVEQR